MRHDESRRDAADLIALLARPGFADASRARLLPDEGAFSATIEASAERLADSEGACKGALERARDEAYRAVLAAGGAPGEAPCTDCRPASESAWIARVTVAGRIRDLRKAASPDFIEAGDFVYILGSPSDSESNTAVYEAVRRGVSGRMVRSCRAIGAPGGLVYSLAAACLPGGFGLSVLLDDLPGAPDEIRDLLFGAEGARFIAGIRREDRERFERSFRGLPHRLLGLVSRDPGIFFSRGARILLSLEPGAEGYAATAHW